MSCCCISDLSDPSKFTNQMKRECKSPTVPRPSIKRHNTSIRFSDNLKQLQPPASGSGPSRRRIQSAKDGATKVQRPSTSGEEEECEGGDTFEVSVEMESCVSALELVQLQMDKLGELVVLVCR